MPGVNGDNARLLCLSAFGIQFISLWLSLRVSAFCGAEGSGGSSNTDDRNIERRT